MGMVLYFLFTLFVSCGTLFVAMNMSGSNSLLLWCIGAGLWIPFIFVVDRREKESRRRKERERMLDEWLRSQTRNRY